MRTFAHPGTKEIDVRRVVWLLPVILTAACSSVAPNAGEEAVLIRKPMFFGHGGVDGSPVRTGRTYVAWTTEHVIVNMQPVAFQQAFDDMNSSDGAARLQRADDAGRHR